MFYRKPMADHQIQAAAVVSMALFGCSGFFSIIGLIKSRRAHNSSYLRGFFGEIMMISLLEVMGAVMVYFNSTSSNLNMTFFERCLSSFSIIFQFALILTIAYGWNVASWKIKESTYVNFEIIKRRRIIYIALVVGLFVAYLVASISLTFYLLIEGKTSDFVLDIFDLIFEMTVILCCLIQVIQGRVLSQLLATYEVLFGIRMKRCRFNMVYIAAFIINLVRGVIEVSELIFELVEKKTPTVVKENELVYYVVYVLLEFVPMVLYLVGIKASAPHRVERNSSSTSQTNRSSLETEMVDRISVDY